MTPNLICAWIVENLLAWQSTALTKVISVKNVVITGNGRARKMTTHETLLNLMNDLDYKLHRLKFYNEPSPNLGDVMDWRSQIAIAIDNLQVDLQKAFEDGTAYNGVDVPKSVLSHSQAALTES